MRTNTNVQAVVMSVRGRRVVRYRDRITGRFCAKPVSVPVSAPVTRELYCENKVFITVFLVLAVLSALAGVPEMVFGLQILTVVGILAVSLFSMAVTIAHNERIIAGNRHAREVYRQSVSGDVCGF